MRKVEVWTLRCKGTNEGSIKAQQFSDVSWILRDYCTFVGLVIWTKEWRECLGYTLVTSSACCWRVPWTHPSPSRWPLGSRALRSSLSRTICEAYGSWEWDTDDRFLHKGQNGQIIIMTRLTLRLSVSWVRVPHRTNICKVTKTHPRIKWKFLEWGNTTANSGATTSYREHRKCHLYIIWGKKH